MSFFFFFFSKNSQTVDKKSAKAILRVLRDYCSEASDRKKGKAAARALAVVGSEVDVEEVLNESLERLHAMEAPRQPPLYFVATECQKSMPMGKGHGERFLALLRDERKAWEHGGKLTASAGKGKKQLEEDSTLLCALKAAVRLSVSSTGGEKEKADSFGKEVADEVASLLAFRSLPKSDDLRMRIGLQALRLCQAHEAKLPMPTLLTTMILVAGHDGEPSQQLRERAVLKVKKRMARGLLGIKWLAALALASHHSETAHDALREYVSRLRERLNSASPEVEGSGSSQLAHMPEFMLPYLVAAVASHEDFPTKHSPDDDPNESFAPFAESLSAGIEVRSHNFPPYPLLESGGGA